jgi:hypothetical protein
MKCKSLLILFLVCFGFSLNAQTFTNNWQKNELSFPWFTTLINLNGLAYNPVTDKLYVAARGENIYIINPATGEAPVAPAQQTLSTANVIASNFNFNKVAVTATGEIYAITIAPTAGATLGKCAIYYWSSETADPVLVSGDITDWIAERAGDTFAVTGSGDNVVLYVGGLNGVNVQVIAKNNLGKLVKVNTINLGTTAGLAAAAIAPVTTGTTSDIWVSGFNGTTFYAKRKYSSTGTRLATPASDLLVNGEYTVPNSISRKFLGLKYFEIGSRKFLVTNGAYHNTASITIPVSGEELALHIYDITGVTNDAASVITLVAKVSMTNTLTSNVIPTANVDFKSTVHADNSVTMQFFQVVNHNAFAAHSITFKEDGTLPVALSSFTASLVKNQHQLNWSTSSETNNAGFEIESSLDGINFNKIGFVASKGTNSNQNLNYTFQDKLAQYGTTYYRLKQLDLDGKFSYSDTRFINNQLSALRGVKVYPNPTEDFVQVDGLDIKGATISLSTTSGDQVNTAGLIDGNKVMMKGLNPGIYILKITNNNELMQSFKVVKQ